MLKTYDSPNQRLYLRERALGKTVFAEWAAWNLVDVCRLLNTMRVRVNVQVLASFATADHSFVPLPALPSRSVELVADDHTAVLEDGTLCLLLFVDENGLSQVRDLRDGSLSPLPPGVSWPAYVDSLPELMMLQGQQFAEMADIQAIPFSAMINAHIRAALRMGRFD